MDWLTVGSISRSPFVKLLSSKGYRINNRNSTTKPSKGAAVKLPQPASPGIWKVILELGLDNQTWFRNWSSKGWGLR